MTRLYADGLILGHPEHEALRHARRRKRAGKNRLGEKLLLPREDGGGSGASHCEPVSRRRS
jgi:hypothetical protein